MATTALTVDVSALEGVGTRLGEITGEALGVANVKALNQALDKVYALSRTRMVAGINLTDSYLRRKFVVTPASQQRPTAVLTAVGTQTLLSEYRPVQKERNVRWSNARILEAGHTFGKWPGWTRRTGHPDLAIEPDRKADGLSATVTDTRRTFAHAFALAGKIDGSGNKIMFTRKAGGVQIRALLGPSAYQLFAYQLRGTLIGETEDLLAEQLTEQVATALQKVFGP